MQQLQKDWNNYVWRKAMTPGLETRVRELLKSHTERLLDGKVASPATKRRDRDVILGAFRRWYVGGYRIEKPENVGEKHIAWLIQNWYKTGKSPKTMRNELSRLGIFFRKLGKGGMVGKLEKYLPDVDLRELAVHAAAKRSKSATISEAYVMEMIKAVDSEDWRLGLMLRIELTFLLERGEVVEFKPHVQDHGTWFADVSKREKRGKQRRISAEARQVLDYVKSRVGKNEALGWPISPDGGVPTLEQNKKRYENLMAKLGFTKKQRGITGRGLRMLFSQNPSLCKGLIPPSLGGTSAQLPKEDSTPRGVSVPEDTGHHIAHIAAAYCYAFGPERIQDDEIDRTLTNLEKAAAVLLGLGLGKVPSERLDDCVEMRSALTYLDCDLSIKAIHALWEIACRRDGLEWQKPKGQIAIMLEGAAQTLLQQGSDKNAA